MTAPAGGEQLMGTFGYLDVSPLGPHEEPKNRGASWHPHDQYPTLEAIRQ